MKYFKIALCIFVVVSLFACADGPQRTEQEVTALQTTKTESGNSVWTGSRFPIVIEVDKSFKFLGEKRVWDGKKTADFSLWQNEDGVAIYIIDWHHQTWSFPSGEDGLNPPSTNRQYLLDYKEGDYAIWKGISPRSYKVIKDLGAKIPECKVSLNRAFIPSSGRNKAVFVVLFEPWPDNPCDYEDFKEILHTWDKYVKVLSK